jgi:hypothetical protein
MASKGKPGSALFLAASTLDGSEDSGTRVDGSEEAMRRLRHPFAVASPPAPGRTEGSGERPE